MTSRTITGAEAAALSATASRLKTEQRAKGIINMKPLEEVKTLKLDLGNATSALKDVLITAAARFQAQHVRAGNIKLSNDRILYYAKGEFSMSGTVNGGATLNKALTECSREWFLEAAQAIPDFYNKLMREDETLLVNLIDVIDSVERFCDKLEGKS